MRESGLTLGHVKENDLKFIQYKWWQCVSEEESISENSFLSEGGIVRALASKYYSFKMVENHLG